MGLADNLTRALGLGGRAPAPAAALYTRTLERARDPAWFAAGGVPDTLDGRFDMLALVAALVILRLQTLGLHQTEADVTDRFTADMDASLRELGVSDLAIARQVGNTVGALGGRISAYRTALAAPEDAALADALTRNLYRGTAPPAPILDWAVAQTRALAARLDRTTPATLEAGQL